MEGSSFKHKETSRLHVFEVKLIKIEKGLKTEDHLRGTLLQHACALYTQLGMEKYGLSSAQNCNTILQLDL